MSKVGLWSTTAGNNNAAPPDGWPEGQAPSTVNDCARENMAALKTAIQDIDFFDHGFSPTFINTTSFSVPGDQTARLNAGRKLKLYDATTHVREIGSASFTTVTTVSLGAGTALTSSLSSFGVSIINPDLPNYPNNVFNKNIILNGEMSVWQRGNDFSLSAGVNRVADMFLVSKNVDADIVAHRLRYASSATFVPSIGEAGVLFASSLQIAIVSADVAIAAGQFLTVETLIEGFNINDCIHQDMNLSFWVQTAQTGTYGVSICNIDSSVSYITNYTISATNWNKYSIPIPAAPISPYTWNRSSGVGLRVRFCLAAGTTYQATGTNNWTAANVLCTSSQFNFAGTITNSSFLLTGVKLEKGKNATPYVIEPFATVLARCQRYFEVMGITPNPATPIFTSYFYKVAKRVAPAITVASGSTPAGFTIGTGIDPSSSFRAETTTSGAAADIVLYIDSNLI